MLWYSSSSHWTSRYRPRRGMLWYSGRQDTGRGEGCYGTVAHHTRPRRGMLWYSSSSHWTSRYRPRRRMLWYSGRQDTGRGERCYGTVDVKIQPAATDAMVQRTSRYRPRRRMLWYSGRQDTGRGEGCYGTVGFNIPLDIMHNYFEDDFMGQMTQPTVS